MAAGPGMAMVWLAGCGTALPAEASSHRVESAETTGVETGSTGEGLESGSSESTSDADTTAGEADCAIELVLPGPTVSCTPVVDAAPELVPDAVVESMCQPGADPSAPTLLVLGDSFSASVAEQIEARAAGQARVCTLSRAGARTAQWMADEDLHGVGHGVRSVALAALQGTVAPRIIVTIGAADVGNGFLSDGVAALHTVHCDLQWIFAELAQAAPQAEVLIAGYDITNFNPGFFSETLGVSCPEAAAHQFGVETMPNPRGEGVVVVHPACANAPLYALDQVYTQLAADDAGVGYTPIYGTLQDRPPGQPDLDRFANPAYYRDCVHMNDTGATLFVDRFVEFWGPLGGRVRGDP